MPTDHPNTEPDAGGSPELPCVPQYEIRVAGRLAPRWAAWFDGLDLTTAGDGTTVMRGAVTDQAALHGLLQKLRDLGVPLVSLTEIPLNQPAERPAVPDQSSPHNTSGATS